MPLADDAAPVERLLDRGRRSDRAGEGTQAEDRSRSEYVNNVLR